MDFPAKTYPSCRSHGHRQRRRSFCSELSSARSWTLAACSAWAAFAVSCAASSARPKLARSEQRTWFRALCSNATIVMREFLRSAEWTDQQRMAAEHRGKMATAEQGQKQND
jgi:hypothetical protein